MYARKIPRKREPEPNDYLILDRTLNPPHIHTDHDPVTALAARVAYDEPKPPLINRTTDEPPPEYDPLYSPTDQHTKANSLAARHRRQVTEKKANKQYQNALLDAMGEDRAKFDKVLSSSGDPKIRRFMMAVASFQYANWPIGRIASKFGIKEAELSTLWKDYHLSRAMLTVTSAIPRAMERIVQDAVAGQTVCPHCDGRTTVKMEIQPLPGEPVNYEEEPKYRIIVCPQCQGEGTIWKPGHEHSREKMLQVVGWGAKTAPATNVTLNQTLKFGGVESVIDELEREKSTARILNISPDAEPKQLEASPDTDENRI